MRRILGGALLGASTAALATDGFSVATVDASDPSHPVFNVNGMPMTGGIGGIDVFGNSFGSTF